MSWLAVKYGIQKAWLWCKHNWKVVALFVYTLVLYLFFSKNARNAKTILDEARNAHKAEVELLKNSHSLEIQKRNENLKKYNDTLKAIEVKYAEENKKLSLLKKRRVKEIVDKHGDDPQKLAELVSDTFGIQIYNGEESE
tara:strand:- start:813 stop:1232 length:420 start_codon:yes stop_codon:yes gene_type:complete